MNRIKQLAKVFDLRKSALAFFALAVVSVAFLFSLSTVSVFAAEGPYVTTTAPQKMDYIVSKDSYTDIYQTHLKIYSIYPHIGVTIMGKDMCTNTASASRTSDEDFVAPSAGMGSLATTYTLSTAGASAITMTNGVWSSSSTCYRNNSTESTLTASASAGGYDYSIGRYVFDLDALANTAGSSGKYKNSFWVSVRTRPTLTSGWTSSGIIVSMDPTSNADKVGFQRSTPVVFTGSQRYYPFEIPFGPSCSVSSSTSARITFYDDDNRGNPGVQPTPFRFRLLSKPRVGGSWAYERYTAAPYTSQSPTTLAISGPDSNGYYTFSNSGSQVLTTFTYNFSNSRIYRLVFDNVYDNNTLQATVPYSQVYYSVPCVPHNLVPSTSVGTTSITPGESIASVAGTITNTAAVTSPLAATAVTRFVLPTGVPLTRSTAGEISLSNNTNYACQIAAAVASGGTYCRALYQNSSGSRFNTGGTGIYSGNDTLAGVTVRPGDKVCYITVVNNYSASTGGLSWRHSAPTCVPIYYAGSIEPILTTTPGNGAFVTDGSSFTATFGVKNTVVGVGDISVEYNSWIWYENTAPDRIYNAAGDVRYFDVSSTGGPAGAGTSAPVIVSANGAEVQLSLDTRTLSLASGSRVCAGLQVNTSRVGVRVSPLSMITSCVTIGKIPTVQVWGNDMRIGSLLTPGGIGSIAQGTLSKLQGSGGPEVNYGSWGEYGVFAPTPYIGTNSIIGLASGSGLATGGSDQQSAWSRLTFANSPTYGAFATPANMKTIPNIGSYLTRAGLVGVVVRNNTGILTISNTAAPTYRPSSLTSGNIIVNSTGTVTIADNISYPATIANESAMPQLVIIAPSINILSNVTNIDAWLIAPSGTINTCSNGPAQLTINDCNTPLKINGAITANYMQLRRTAGGGASTPESPGEILNLRGDAYIWARRISEANGTWVTKSITELPPRY